MVSQRQLEANRRNWQLWRGASPEGRTLIAAACKRNRPWERSTGPRTATGLLRSRANALRRGRRCRTLEPFASADVLCRALRIAVAEEAERIRTGQDPDADSPMTPAEDALSDAIARFLRTTGVQLHPEDDRPGDGFFGLLLRINGGLDKAQKAERVAGERVLIVTIGAMLRIERARRRKRIERRC